MMEKKRIRCGIIGCGVIGPLHADGFSRLPDVEVAWACDLAPERAERLAARFGVPRVSTDYRQLLDDPALDAVAICTDHGSHARIACDALAAGKHVLCEKALASDAAGLDQMERAGAANPGLVFSGVFQHRFDLVNQYARGLLADGLLGRVLTASLSFCCLRTEAYYKADAWRGTWALEGGSVLMNQAIHHIDILAWLMGGVARVSAFHANLERTGVIETEDTASAALQFKNGALGALTATSAGHLDWDWQISFHGTRGAMDIRSGRIARFECADGEACERVRRESAEIRERPALPAGKHYYGASHLAQIADFVGAIREGRPPFVTAASARHAVDIALSVYQSQREGRPVDLPS